MRLAALIAATLSLTAGTCLAQTAPVVSVTPVSYSLAADVLDQTANDGSLTRDNINVGFSLGSPEGRGDDATLVKRAAPRAVVRTAQNRVKKSFSMPWQTGVFQ